MGKSKELNEKAIEAAKRYLMRREYEVLDERVSDRIDIVAKDEDALVFFIVKARMDELPRESVDMEKMELEVYKWLASNDYVDMKVRFDVISMAVIADNRALVRHHVNAFSMNGGQE